MIHFTELRHKNLERCVKDFNHPLDKWSVAEWGAATAGECGEACNVAKKLIRIRDGMVRFNNKTNSELNQQLADELADMVIYADLWAAAAGIDLGLAVVTKFNRDSKKHGSQVSL